MNVQISTIQTSEICGWDSFHSVFAKSLGFPDFYGRNMNAWIDCLTYFDDGMTSFTLAPGDLFCLELAEAKAFSRRLPEIFQALLDAAAFVNWRRVETGKPPILALVLR